jgi:transposase
MFRRRIRRSLYSRPRGGFESTIAAALVNARITVAVVTPRQVRDFARATGRLAKTYAIDARVIAHFAETVAATSAFATG